MKKTPNKMIGGMVGAMAQQPGAIDPATGMTVAQPQLGQMAQNPYPNQNALGQAQAAKIPGLFPGSAFNQNQQTFGILNAKNSEEAGISEAKRLAAQKEALAKKKKENKKKKDPVSGNKKETKTVSAPARTYTSYSSKTIYNEDGSISAKQTIK